MTRTNTLRLVATEPTPSPLPPTEPSSRDQRRWRPPRASRRLAMVALVLAGSALLARWLPQPDPASTEIAGAREVTAYELVAGAPLSFSLPPGATELRVLTNLDLPPSPPAEGVPYALQVRVPEDGRDQTFPLLATPSLDATGGRTAFFLGRADGPARTRMLTLLRTSALPATLEVTLASPQARASLRVLVAHERLGSGPPGHRPPALVGLPLEDLAPEARAAIEAHGWSRLPTRTKTATRGFYVVGGPPGPPAPRPVGEAVGDGHVVAFTVTGPGTVDLEAPEGLSGEAALLDRDGITRLEPLALGPGGRVSLAVGNGLTTLRVTARRPGRVRLIGEPRLAVRPEQPLAGGGEVELGPAWSWQALSVAGPDGPPVEIAAGGRGEAALRITARVPLGPTPAPAHDGELRWRFVDGRGAVLQHGVLAVPAAVAPEDRIDGPASFVGTATSAFLWAPRGAERLLLTAPRPVAVSVSSPALESALAPADELGIDRALVLRHRDSGAYEPVSPLNQAELRRLGRVLRFAGAQRLELRTLPPPAAEATSLAPQRGGARFVLLAPLETAPGEHRDGVSFAIRPARDENVLVARPRGASARARVAATLYYEVDGFRGRGSLTVSLDGQVVRRASVLGKRGQLVLPPVAVGRHHLRVDLPPGGRAFIDQRVIGAAPFRRSRVYTLRGGGALVALPKGKAARSLGVVLYADGPGPAGARLEAVVDGGHRARRSGGASHDYTRLQRRAPLAFRKVAGARYLNRAQGEVWASEPVFIPLGDDLRAGGHRIALRTVGLGGAPLARFFSYGGPVQSRISQRLELRAEDDE